jgi:small-conductance mechanosensitive channel
MMESLDVFLIAKIGGSLLGTAVIAKISSRLLAKLFERTEFPENIERGMVQITRYVIYFLGLMAIVSILGIDLSAVIMGIGAMSIAISFATKDIIQNLISGIILYADRPFRLRDRIHVKNYEGVVIRIGIRSTILRTDDGDVITIPNSMLVTSPVRKIKKTT